MEAKTKEAPLYFPSDPQVSGPGLWFIIHTTAKEAKSEEQKKAFLALMETLSRYHPCSSECRPHIQAYLKDHPIANYWTVPYNGEDVGLFLWSFNFHNTVNARLKKRQIDFHTAYNMYCSEAIVPCSSTCSGQHQEDETKSVPKLKFARRER